MTTGFGRCSTGKALIPVALVLCLPKQPVNPKTAGCRSSASAQVPGSQAAGECAEEASLSEWLQLIIRTRFLPPVAATRRESAASRLQRGRRRPTRSSRVVTLGAEDSPPSSNPPLHWPSSLPRGRPASLRPEAAATRSPSCVSASCLTRRRSEDRREP